MCVCVRVCEEDNTCMRASVCMMRARNVFHVCEHSWCKRRWEVFIIITIIGGIYIYIYIVMFFMSVNSCCKRRWWRYALRRPLWLRRKTGIPAHSRQKKRVTESIVYVCVCIYSICNHHSLQERRKTGIPAHSRQKKRVTEATCTLMMCMYVYVYVCVYV